MNRSTCVRKVQSLRLVHIFLVSYPADVVDGRQWIAVVFDLTRQRQLHADIGVVVERVRVDALRAFFRYSDESLVGHDCAPSVADTTLIIALERVHVVALDTKHLVSPAKYLTVLCPPSPATRHTGLDTKSYNVMIMMMMMMMTMTTTTK